MNTPGQGRSWKRLTGYTGVCITAFCIMFVFGGLVDRYRQLEAGNDKAMAYALALESLAVENYFSILRAIAGQISSRSQLRNLMDDYNQGKTSLATLQQDAAPRLAEALESSGIIVGITRHDRQGKAVMHSGITVTDSDRQLTQSIRIYGPLHIAGQSLLAVSSPVRGMSGHVGTDVILVSMDTLHQQLNRDTRLHNGNLFIAARINGGLDVVASRTNIIPPRLLQKINLEWREGKGRGEVDSNAKTLHYRWSQLGNIDWVIVQATEKLSLPEFLQKGDLSARIGLLLILTVVGGIWMLMLLRSANRQADNGSEAGQDAGVATNRHSELILNTAGVGICGLDQHGQVTFVNPSAAAMLGHNANNIIGKSYQKLLYFNPASDAPANPESSSVWQSMHSKEQQQRDDEIFWREDGTGFPVQCISRPIIDGDEVTGAVVTFQDISEKKNAAAAVLASEQHFRSLDIIAGIIVESPDLDTLTTLLTTTILTLFDCDRVWLQTPCDPEAKSVSIVAEVVSGDYPQVFPLNTSMPVDATLSGWMSETISSLGPVVFDFSRQKNSPDMVRRQEVSTQMLVVVHSGVQDPWMLGLQQCSRQRQWTDSERRLLGDIATRMGLAIANRSLVDALEADIEERKKVEAELRNSKTGLANVERIARLGNWEWRADSDSLHWSAEVYSIFGLDKGAFDGRLDSFYQQVHPDDLDRVQQTFTQAHTDLTSFDIKHRIVLPDNTTRFVQQQGSVTADDAGQASAIQGTVQDITERELTRAELRELNSTLEQRVNQRTAALEESQKYNRALFETSPVGLVLQDMNGNVVDVNQAYADIIGYSTGDATGIAFRDIASSTYPTHEKTQLKQLRETGRYGPLEDEFRHRDGHQVPVQMSGVRIVQNDETFVWSAVENISRRKKAERALQQARDDAEAASVAKSLFLANMSHEIRTPMNGVLGMLRLLGKTSLNEKQREFVDTANGSSKILLTVINDVLDYSKIEAGKLELESIPFDPADLATQIACLHANGVFEKNVELICLPDPALPNTITGDPVRLRQVLTNLLTNAIKFTQSGEIELYVSTMSESLLFGVRDTGIGLTKDQQKNLFTAFTQADTSHTRKYGGTGLGLAICKHLVAAMGGQLQLVSEPGKGSSFSFELPLKAEDLDQENKRPAVDLSGQRILLADACNTHRNLLVNLLENWQVGDIHYAASGEESLQILRESVIRRRPFDAVIIDTQLEGMGGLDLVREIEADRTLQKLPVIVFSASGREPGIHPLDWLDKPVSQSSWQRTLQSVISPASEHNDVPETGRLNQNEPEGCWFGGLRLLLAEDNKTNQLVAKEILEDVGFTIDITENGEEALAAIKRQHYDVVLMDIQMPQMDGIEATRKIRALGGQYSEIPIIAMTAHALIGDREKSLKAGMEGHITKPFEGDDVYQELSRWLKQTNKPAKKQNVSLKPATGHGIPELPGINVQEGLQRMCDNQSIYRQVLLGFRKNQADAADIIESCLRDNDHEGAARHAHSLKGSSGNISAMAVYETASAIEACCRNQQQEKVPDLLSVLRQKLEQVINGLDVLAQSQSDARARHSSEKRLDTRELTDLLDRLESCLESDIGEAQDCLDFLASEASGTYLANPFEALEAAFDCFDMDAARQNIVQLKQQIAVGEPVAPPQQKKGA